MASINPKALADGYKNQEQLNTQSIPPKGTYHMVNVALQEKGSEEWPKVRVVALVLAHIEGEGGAIWKGKKTGFDMWANYDNERSLQDMGNLGIACGTVTEWDPENKDQLAKVICGVPYSIKLDNKVREYNGNKMVDIKIIKVGALSPEVKAKYVSDPDWAKISGDPTKRWMEKKAAGGSSGGQDGDPGAQHDPYASESAPPF